MDDHKRDSPEFLNAAHQQLSVSREKLGEASAVGRRGLRWARVGTLARSSGSRGPKALNQKG